MTGSLTETLVHTGDESRRKLRPPIWREIIVALGVIYLSWGIVVAGLAFGSEFLTRQAHANRNPAGLFNAFGAWDGVWYQRITALGYDYDPSKQSSVAYFPMLPTLATTIRSTTGLDALSSLLVVSWTAHIASGIALLLYLRAHGDTHVSVSVLLCFCLWPMGLFFRLAYTESLFVMWLILASYGIQRRWSLISIALLAGAATGTRSAGVAMLLPLLWEVRQRSDSTGRAIFRSIFIVPIATWGLLAYMAFQYVAFGDAAAFAKTQAHWSAQADLPWAERLLAIVTLKPIWSLYVPGSNTHWVARDLTRNPLFSLWFWNGVYFVTCVGIVAYGARKKLITTHEWLLSAGLLAIPYALQGHRMMMLGHGRFTCVVFPAFIVLGKLMAKWPAAATNVVLALMGIQLFYWSALFAAWYYVF